MIDSEQILVRAEEMFLRYGFKRVTMDDLANELGISKKTLYQHIENKRDLIDRITRQYIHTQKHEITHIQGMSNDAIHEIVLIARHIVRILRRMRPSSMFDLKKYYRDCWSRVDKFHLTHVYRVMRRNVERGIEEGLYRENLDADIVAKLYVGKTMLLVDEGLFPVQDYDREKLFTEYINYHLHGIATERGLNMLKKYQDAEH